MNLIELDVAVKKWACDRGIDRGDGLAQELKVQEEYGELCAAVLRNDIDKIKDSIGDFVVTIIILNLQLDCRFDVIASDEHMMKVDNIHRVVLILKDYMMMTDSRLLYNLNTVANHYGTTVRECLELAYNEIKGRTGKKVNGTFVKSADLNEQINMPKSATLIGR